MTGLYKQRFVIIDTETTGADTKSDRPIEVAATEMIGGVLGNPVQWQIDPQMLITPAASAVHHLTDRDVQGKPTLADIMPELLAFVGDSPLVAHNAAFDRNMLPGLATDQHRWICSLRFARHIWNLGTRNHANQPLDSHKQQEIRYWLGLDVDTKGLQAHRAAADILVTGTLFQVALDKYLEKDQADHLAGLRAFVDKPIEYPFFPFGRYKFTAWSDVPNRILTFQAKDEPSNDPDVTRLARKEIERRALDEKSLRNQLAFVRSGASTDLADKVAPR